MGLLAVGVVLCFPALLELAKAFSAEGGLITRAIVAVGLELLDGAIGPIIDSVAQEVLS